MLDAGIIDAISPGPGHIGLILVPAQKFAVRPAPHLVQPCRRCAGNIIGPLGNPGIGCAAVSSLGIVPVRISKREYDREGHRHDSVAYAADIHCHTLSGAKIGPDLLLG